MLKVILMILLVIGLCLIAVMICDCNRFVVHSYDVVSEKVDKPCRYVLMADLHNKCFGRENRRLTDAVDRLHPDGILMAGDMMTASVAGTAEPALQLVRALREKYPVYYGIGNHEYRAKLDRDVYGELGVTYQKELRDMGVTPLDNLRVSTPEGIEVCGLAIDRKYYKKIRRVPMDVSYMEKVVGKADQDAFLILIAHNPRYFDVYAQWGADLTVSGHVHGGLMRLPLLGGVVSPDFTFFPKYDGGMFELNGRKMIVSRGLGTHTIPIRIFNPGELIVIDIHP